MSTGRGLGQKVEGASVPSVVVGLAKGFDSLEKEVEELETQLKALKHKRDDAEKKLVDEMVTQGLQSVRVEGVGGFRTQVVVYPNVVNREALNDHVSKDPELKFLYTVSVNGTKLKSFVKELMEQGKQIPPGIEPYNATEIRRFK